MLVHVRLALTTAYFGFIPDKNSNFERLFIAFLDCFLGVNVI